MALDDSVTHWIERVKAGDSQAAAQIWERYFEQLVSYARKKFGSTPRRTLDEEDIALSAMYSLYRGAQADKFRQLESRSDLWQLLMVFAARKVINHQRAQQTWKRAGRVPTGEQALEDSDPPAASREISQIVRSEPPTDSVVQIAEECERMLALLNDELRRVACWRLEGYTNAEIAAQLGRHERSVERKIHLIRQKWSVEQ